MKMNNKKKVITRVLVIYIAFVFIQSLFFKFTGSPETDHIFGTLDQWASATFGIDGLFLPPGIFNAYVVGTVELIASLLLLGGLFTEKKILLPVGAFLSLEVITGAIFFHLFTPLGIEVMGDGGTLFFMACGIWLSSATLIVMHKDVLLTLINKKV
jgi:uncharacterized membrane protein YphA (DoxX/SURF4 family)